MREFPIQRTWQTGPEGERKRHGPQVIPWELIAAHEKQALINHGGQTLQRLAERGGLCACETVAILEDRKWRQFADHDAAVAQLEEILRAWEDR